MSQQGNHAPQPSVDLDQFLSTGGGGGQQAAPGNGGLAMPEADRIVLVGVLADDSGSIRDAGLEHAVVDGLKLSVEAFRGAKGSDFALEVRGFEGTYFRGMLKDATDGAFDKYVADGGSTPLVSHAIALITELHAKAEQYRALGIPATVALLLVTDGFPNCDTEAPEAFPPHITESDYIVGMGIGRGEENVAAFSALFRTMGITKVLTPKADAADVRHAINQFSQSVASIAA